MENNLLANNIYYIGVDDKTIDLFEGQYVVPNGVSYNSYVIMDNKICIMDTVDSRMTKEWLANLEKTLNNKNPDYLVVLHMEPDHAGSLDAFLKKYPSCKVVSNIKAFNMMGQFFEDLPLEGKTIEVKENDTLSLGKHTLHFVFAPMVHWPEVMVAYEETDKVLFSADGFGKFGALDTDEDWTCEARRYYINIVGKYGGQVQLLLKKAASLDIQKIFPLHGPMLTENLGYYINKYDIWSSYTPEDKGIFIAYTSVYGHTKAVAEKLKIALEAKGQKVSITDLAREDMAEALEDAFRYDRLVLATTTYDAGIFPQMETFISHLKAKTYQNRTIALIENGSWAPMAAKKMKAELESLKNITFIDPILTIKSAYKKENEETFNKFVEALCK
ncbi:MAG: flavodoxin domain-containing protein [Alphaproteobacteria bacterium]|nr:flavodoxin domain-containing protein [Alphaproteobacteria bacterium]